jgi:hypothetical protein
MNGLEREHDGATERWVATTLKMIKGRGW